MAFLSVCPQATGSPAATTRRASTRCTLIVTATQKPQQRPDNILVSGIVSGLTNALRVAGIGKPVAPDVLQQPATLEQPVAEGDVDGMLQALHAEYANSYFITGVVSGCIYEPDCEFADPTVKFRGVQRYKNNLQLLVPFLENPELRLTSLRCIKSDMQQPTLIKAEWTLRSIVKVPWRPFVDVIGATEYSLNPQQNQIIRHVESWNITAWQALGQLLRPGKYAGNHYWSMRHIALQIQSNMPSRLCGQDALDDRLTAEFPGHLELGWLMPDKDGGQA